MKKSIQKELKGTKSEYKEFFIHHYSKLHEEHPQWTPVKYTKIISLLWKKRIMKNLKFTFAKKPRVLKPISGRMAFKKAKLIMGKYSAVEIMARWKRLPFESKNIWQNIGNPNLRKNLNPMDLAKVSFASDSTDDV